MPIYFDTFKTWKNNSKVFVESGTLHGLGCQKALEAGFSEIYTVEINAVDRQIAIDKFNTEPELIKLAKGKKINFILGDSSVELENIMKNVTERCSIWLDAHFGDINTYKFDHLPLIKELNTLKKYSDKVETIWIDDIRLLVGEVDNTGYLPWTKQEIINKLLEINPNFKITYDHGFIKDDIMVAYLEK